MLPVAPPGNLLETGLLTFTILSITVRSLNPGRLQRDL